MAAISLVIPISLRLFNCVKFRFKVATRFVSTSSSATRKIAIRFFYEVKQCSFVGIKIFGLAIAIDVSTTKSFYLLLALD